MLRAGLTPLAAATEFEMFTHFIITSADDLYISPSLSSASEAAYLQERATLCLSQKRSVSDVKKTSLSCVSACPTGCSVTLDGWGRMLSQVADAAPTQLSHAGGAPTQNLPRRHGSVCIHSC